MSHQLNTPFPSKQIYLSSKHATKTNSGGYQFVFKDALSIPSNYSYLASIVDAQIPYSFYAISEARKNNKLFFDYIFPGVEETHEYYTVTLQDGNYNIYEILDEIVKQLPVGYITASYDERTNKVTLSTTIADGMSLGIQGHTLLEDALGFTVEDDLGTRYIHQASSVVNLTGINSIYVRTNLATGNLDSRNSGASNILAKIPILAIPHSYISFENPTGHKTRLRDKHITIIEIHLEDENGNQIDFNDQSWQMTLQFDVYKPQKLIRTMDHRSEKVLEGLKEFLSE